MDFPLDTAAYERIALVGRGAFSEVYRARCKTNGKELAVKVVNLDDFPMEMDFLRQEVSMWSSFEHPNIVPYYGSFLAGKELCILMEYMDGGSLFDIMRFGFQKGFSDETLIATLLKSMTEALVAIHQRNEIHRDVKPGNAILGHDGTLKIGDFGVATTLLEEGQRLRARYTQIGTPCYMAPELFSRVGHTEKADIWSLGISAIELATGSAPYATLGNIAIAPKILKAPPPQLPRRSGFSDSFRDFVKCCMNFEQDKRPSAADLLKHEFLKKAANAAYVADNILRGLPPLSARYEKISKGDDYVDPVSDKAPVSVPQWSFGDMKDVIAEGRELIGGGTHDLVGGGTHDLVGGGTHDLVGGTQDLFAPESQSPPSDNVRVVKRFKIVSTTTGTGSSSLGDSVPASHGETQDDLAKRVERLSVEVSNLKLDNQFLKQEVERLTLIVTNMT